MNTLVQSNHLTLNMKPNILQKKKKKKEYPSFWAVSVELTLVLSPTGMRYVESGRALINYVALQILTHSFMNWVQSGQVDLFPSRVSGLPQHHHVPA